MELGGNLETVSNKEVFANKLEGNLNKEVSSIPAGLVERALFIQEWDQNESYLASLTEAVLEQCRGEKHSEWSSDDEDFKGRLAFELKRNLPAEIKSVDDNTLKQALSIKESRPELTLMESFIEAVREDYKKGIALEEERLRRANSPRYKITYVGGVRQSVRVK